MATPRVKLFERLFTEAPLFAGLLSFMAGIVAGTYVSSAFLPAVCVAAVGVLIGVLSFLGRRYVLPARWHGVWAVLTFVSIGIACRGVHQRPPLPDWPGERVGWMGVVTDAAERGKTVRCTVQLSGYRRHGRLTACNETVECTFLRRDSMAQPLRTGVAVMGYARIRQPHNAGNPDEFDYAGWLRRKGVTGQAMAWRDWRIVDGTEADKLRRQLPALLRVRVAMMAWRDKMTATLKQGPLAPTERQVVAALSMGDKYQLSQGVRQLYARAGVAHVLALSGLHLGILFTFLMFLLRPLWHRRAGRVVATLLVITTLWTFTLLTGMSISLVRAALMYTMFTLMYQYRHGGTGLNSLCFAAWTILLVNPDALFDVSFQLSFLSVFFILWLLPLTQTVRPGRRIVRVVLGFVYVSLVAQLAVAPVVAYYFGNLSVYALLGNIVVVPCAYVLLGGTWLYFVFAHVPFVGGALAWLLSTVAGFVHRSLTWIVSLPAASVEWHPSLWEVLAAYALLLSLVWLFDERRWRAAAGVALGGCLMACAVMVHCADRRAPSEIVCYNNGRHASVHFIVNNEVSYLWATQPDSALQHVSYVARRFWQRRGIRQPRVFADSITAEGIRARNGFVTFLGKCVMLLSDGRWQRQALPQACSPDIVYVCRGFRGRLASLADSLHPRQVVLDASLYEAQRERLRKECKKLLWPVYDIEEQGAMVEKTP